MGGKIKTQQKGHKTDKLSTKEAREASWQLAKTILGLLLALIIIRFYVFQPFTISGSSMEPTFHNGEYLIVDQLTYQFSNPKRGDIVVFRHPEPACNDHIKSNYLNRVFFQGPCSNYIKRIIGTPGETVMIRDGKVVVKNPGTGIEKVLEENYIPRNIPTLGNQTFIVGEDQYFVMGDNRNPNASSDSREWGALPKAHVVGKALIVLLPPQEFGFVEKVEY